MPVKDIINEDLKNFMRAKDTYALEIIRLLKAEIKNTEIAQKSELDDEGAIRCVKSLIKKHTEALDISVKALRDDLAQKERKYLEVLSKYMPRQLEEADINKLIEEALREFAANSKNSFGLIMKSVMAKAGSAADGKMVSALIKKALEGGG